MLIVSGLVFTGCVLAGAWLGRRISRVAARMLLLLGAGILLVHAIYLLDNVAVVRLLPVSNLIVLGNVSIPTAGLLVGIGARQLPGPWYRRAVFLVPLAGLCLYKAYSPVFITPPETGNAWRGDVCMQTSDSTCGAAATATLLAHHHIPATETEMARLCFTSAQGTSMYDVYRGLMLKTQDTSLRVRPVTGDATSLRQAVRNGPVLISVGLRRGQQADPRFSQIWGWTPGTMHSVVVYAIDPDDRVHIGDPRIGREFWFMDGIETLWHGQGLQIVAGTVVR